MASYYKFRTKWRQVGIKLEEDACEYLNTNSSKLISFNNFKNLPATLPKQCPLSV